jgi:LCP family protein required for cell wall assembly
MIVVRIDPGAERVDMFSIPRDLAVNIPGFSNGSKINSAYPWGESYGVEGGGPGLVASTIEINFGVVIDYYATVDIPGLEQIVDTLGGVIVDADTQLKDDQYPTDDFGYTRAYFPPGIQKLNGEQAVQFARTRHADGDFKRAERQQQVLLAIRDQAIESGIISNLADLIADLRNTVRTDLSPEQVYALANLARDIPRANIWIHSLAPYMSASNTEQGWFLIGDWDALRWITQNLTDDPLATSVPGG